MGKEAEGNTTVREWNPAESRAIVDNTPVFALLFSGQGLAGAEKLTSEDLLNSTLISLALDEVISYSDESIKWTVRLGDIDLGATPDGSLTKPVENRTKLFFDSATLMIDSTASETGSALSLQHLSDTGAIATA